MLVYHSKVYISLFFVYLNCVFGTACVWTAYVLSAVIGAFQRY